ncbi:unnamed protein product [Moneuplotes crassus]|uniref:Uncharacterized protein n=1 Tax=Euplotes crassus TaxID=5936 RepID=A0AAD2D9R1_EUPCR|nr:unnamed protein product [Moneuplotes crassus]
MGKKKGKSTHKNSQETTPGILQNKKKHSDPSCLEEIDRTLTRRCGSLLIVCGFLFFTIGIYWTIVAKFMPDTGIGVLDFMKYDKYTFCAIVALWPLCIVVLGSNWLCLKIFRHI